MSDLRDPSKQFYAVIPVVFAAVLGVIVGTQLSLVDKINRLEARSDQVQARMYQQSPIVPVSCGLTSPRGGDM